jgi:hypothetical protein
VIHQSYAGNFHVAERGLGWENRLDIIGDDAAIVRLRQLRPGSRLQVLNDLAARAACHGHRNG